MKFEPLGRLYACLYDHMQDCLEFRSKMRLIRVRTLEDSIRVISVDGSHTVLEVTKTVCERIGRNEGQWRSEGGGGVTRPTGVGLGWGEEGGQT